MMFYEIHTKLQNPLTSNEYHLPPLTLLITSAIAVDVMAVDAEIGGGAAGDMAGDEDVNSG